MSNPSFSNIDRWLFELMEGNLSPEQEAQLEAFLLMHPELDIDRDMWELAKVESSPVEFTDKNKLHKPKPLVPYFLIGSLALLGVFMLSYFFFIPNKKENISANVLHLTKGSGQLKSYKHLRMNTQVFPSRQVLKAKIQVGSNVNKFSVTSFQFLPENSLSLPSPTEQVSTSSTQLNSLVIGLNNTPSISDSKLSSHNVEKLASMNDSSVEFIPSIKSENNLAIERVEKISSEELMTEADKESKPSAAPGLVQATNEHSTKHSFSLKKSTGNISFKSLGREMKAMVDKPEGLRNLKDPWAFAPGLQGIDLNNGSVGDFLSTRAQASTRLQWIGTASQQIMNQFSIDGYSYGVRGGLGMQVKHRQYGIGGIQHVDVALIYSPKISLTSNLVIEPSVKFNMGNKRLNDQFMKTGQMVEYDRMNMEQYYVEGADPFGRTLWYRDLGAGMLINTRWFYAGIQVDNLLQNHQNVLNYQFDQLSLNPRNVVANIGADYQTKKKDMAMSPYLVYQRYDALEEYWMGSSFRYHWLTAGVSLSNKKELAAMMGVKFDRFMITYSADYIQSQLLGKRALSHQITLRLLSKPCSMGKRLIH